MPLPSTKKDWADTVSLKLWKWQMRNTDGASGAEEQQIRRKEGERAFKIFRGKELLRHCPCNQWKMLDSVAFIGKSQ